MQCYGKLCVCVRESALCVYALRCICMAITPHTHHIALQQATSAPPQHRLDDLSTTSTPSQHTQGPPDDGMQLELTVDMTYEDVTTRLATKLGLDNHLLLRLTQSNAYASDMPKTHPVKFNPKQQLDELMTPGHGHRISVFYYEVLDIPLPELERLKSIKVWVIVAAHTTTCPAVLAAQCSTYHLTATPHCSTQFLPCASPCPTRCTTPPR